MVTEDDYLHQLLTMGQITFEDYLKQFEPYNVYEGMKVTELGDYSMVIEKEPGDVDGFTVGSMFEGKSSPAVKVFVPNTNYEVYKVSEYIFTEDTLIVYFKDCMPKVFKEGIHVGVKVGKNYYETLYDISKTFTEDSI